jgi:hypothetical protein
MTGRFVVSATSREVERALTSGTVESVTWQNFGLIAALAFASGCSTRGERVAKPAPIVVVLEPGAEPRQRLRYEPTPGLSEEVEASTKLRITNTFTNTVLETGQRSADYPTTVIRGRLQVTGRSPEGDALLSFAVEDVRTLGDVVDPRVRQQVDAELQRLRGAHASFRLLPTGELADVKLDIRNTPQERVSRLASSFDEMFVRFPQADIGIGGTWQIETHATISGVKWTKKATYTLRELTDGQATVDVSIAMRAASQALRVEPNATTTLESGEGSTSGQAFVPRHGLVTSGSSQTTTEASFLIVRRHLRISSTVRTETLSAVKRIDAPEL